MERTLDSLERLLRASRTRATPRAAVIALRLLENASYGLAIGLGIAAGLALAG